MSDKSRKYQSINLQDVSGGMNTAEPPNDIADNEFVALKNMEYNTAGELTTRPGMTAVSATGTAVALKGVINNIKIDAPTRTAYDIASGLMFVCETGATNVVFIVDVSNPKKPEFLGSCTDGSMIFPQDAVKHGDYLLISDRWAGNIHVFDISDPGNPVYVRRHTDATYLDWCHQIVREGDYLYCANDDTGGNGALVVLDISDLASGISESNKITTHSGGKWLAHVPGSDRLYQTNQGTDELHVINTADPSSIALVISHLDGVNLNDVGPVQADENYVYMLSATDDKFIILDASNEAGVTITSTLTDAIRLNKIDQWTYKRGSVILCPSYWSDSLTIVNIADPSAPSIIADIAIPGRFDQIIDAVIVDTYIFLVSAADDYLMCLELQVPLPFQTVVTDATYTAAFSYFLRATPDNRWVASYEHVAAKTLRIFDRENQEIIKEVDFAASLVTYFPAHTFDYIVDVCWNYDLTRLYAWCSLNAGGKAGLLVYSFNSSTGKIAIIKDASDDPVAIIFTDGGGLGGCGFYETDSGVPHIAAQNGSGSSQNLLIISVENDDPSQVGEYNWAGKTAVKVQINHVDKVLYTSSTTSLGVFDVSDPVAPVLAVEFTDVDTEDLILQPDRKTLWCFDPAGATTISEWDVSDPILPVKLHDEYFALLTGTADWPWYDADTDKLYLSSAASDALYVINVSSYPWVQEYIYVDAVGLAAPAAVHVSGEYVFSVDNGLISIIHASTEQSFDIVWELSNIPLDEVWGVKHYGHLLGAVSKTSDALSILDISSPEAITQLGSVIDATKLNGAVDLAWFDSGKYILVASTTYNGVVVYDVSDPLDITEMSFITTTALTACNAVVVDSKEEFAYVSAPGYLSVIDLRRPDNITLVAALADATKYAALNGLAFLDDDYLCGIGTNYVNVWDIKLPFSPYIVGSLNDASQPAGRCDSDGTYLYATTNAGDSVRIYDLTDPAAPVFDNEIASLVDAYGIRYVPVDEALWVAAPGDNKVALYDVSDPTTPVVLGYLVDADNLTGSKLIDATGFDVYVPCSTIDRISALRVTGMPFRSDITSIYQLKNEEGVDRVVLTEGNHVLADIGSGIFEVINGSLKLPIDATWRWGMLDGILFGVHGAAPQVTDDDGIVTDYGYPQVVYWDGETSSLQVAADFPEQEIAAIQLATWNHRLFVLAGSSVFYSKLGDGTDFTHTTSGSMDVFPDDGDEATGMIVHKGMLMIFKRRHIYRVLAGVPNTADAKWSLELVTVNSGAISGESIQSVLDDLIFLSSEGLLPLASAEKLGDFETILLSKKIKDLRGLPLSSVRYPAIYWPKKSQYWISIDTDDDGILDKTYVLDMKDSLQGKLKWTVFTGKIVGTAFAIVEVDGVNELYIGSDKLYKLDESVYLDDITSFTTEITTKSYDMQLPANRKELLRWGIEFVKRTATLTLGVDLLYEGSAIPAHTASIDADSLTVDLPQFVRKMVTGQRRWKRLQLKIENTGDEAFELESLYLEASPLTIKKGRSL